MTPVQIKAVHKLIATVSKQSNERLRDRKQHAATKED